MTFMALKFTKEKIMKKISPFELRSTLYMPAIKENLIEIISKQDKTNADGWIFQKALKILMRFLKALLMNQ